MDFTEECFGLSNPNMCLTFKCHGQFKRHNFATKYDCMESRNILKKLCDNRFAMSDVKFSERYSYKIARMYGTKDLCKN